MNKTNKIRILMLASMLSLGFMGNASYGAAAPRAPQDVVREFIQQAEGNMKDEARRILEEFISTANRHEIMVFMKEYVTTGYEHMPFINLILGTMTCASVDKTGVLKVQDVKDILLETVFTENKVRDADRVHLMNRRLRLAVQADSIDKVKSFLDQGVSVDPICHGSGVSALMIASLTGNTDIVRLLINRGANVDYEIGKTAVAPGFVRDAFPYNNALECAVSRNHAAIVDLLIQAGASVECAVFGHLEGSEDRGRITLLKIAVDKAGSNRLDVIKLLVHAGATITPNILVSACQKGEADLVVVLIGGLLKHQVCIQAQKYKRCLVGNGHTGDCCGTLERLSGDPLNRVLGYVGAQGRAALHRTCHGMSQLQPDIEGLRIMLQQATSKKFLRIKKIYLNKSIQLSSEIKSFFEKLIEFLEEEAVRPICDIEKWEASVRCRMETGQLSCEEINALESLIGVVKTYYEESRRMI